MANIAKVSMPTLANPIWINLLLFSDRKTLCGIQAYNTKIVTIAIPTAVHMKSQHLAFMRLFHAHLFFVIDESRKISQL